MPLRMSALAGLRIVASRCLSVVSRFCDDELREELREVERT
jgi:hypothetical protein